MFHTSASVPLAERTVGVIVRNDEKVSDGYNLFASGRETYLLDADGRVVHEWRSDRCNFCSYLLPSGNLLRDGSENDAAVHFKAGGAAGFIEEVTWDNERVWSFSMQPISDYLTHHDLEPLPNGNVLIQVWNRKTKEQCIAAGRRPELLPDGEVWDNIIMEIQPDGEGGADVVWRWSLWDHLVQDFDSARANYGVVKDHPGRFDINFCPPGGKAAQRNQRVLHGNAAPSAHSMGGSGTGEKDWVHANAVSYDPVRDQILVSLNVPGEIIVVDHGTTTEEARGTEGGARGRGGEILYRWGNPQTYRHGTRTEQRLFCQHSAEFLRGVPGDGRVLVFNNGQEPGRHWTSVDELVLPEAGQNDGEYERELGKAFAPDKPVWTHGPAKGRRGSFYCTHIGASQRLANGNTLITQGPDAIAFECTPDGEEVWRYVSPVIGYDRGAAVCFVRQGDQRTAGKRSMFQMRRYAAGYAPLAERAEAIVAAAAGGRYLEA